MICSPLKNARWLRLRTHTPTDCSVLVMSADLSPCMQIPPASHKPLFLFKHHLHPLCLLQTRPYTPISSTVSHHITVTMVRHKIIFHHSDLSLIQVLSNGCGGGEGTWQGGEGSSEEHAARMHDRCTFAPLPPLSYSISHIKLMVKLL